MSCSARLPGLHHSDRAGRSFKVRTGFPEPAGLVMMDYLLAGLALIVAYIAKWFIGSGRKLILSLSCLAYRAPKWSNVLRTMISKAGFLLQTPGHHDLSAWCCGR